MRIWGETSGRSFGWLLTRVLSWAISDSRSWIDSRRTEVADLPFAIAAQYPAVFLLIRARICCKTCRGLTCAPIFCTVILQLSWPRYFHALLGVWRWCRLVTCWVGRQEEVFDFGYMRQSVGRTGVRKTPRCCRDPERTRNGAKAKPLRRTDATVFAHLPRMPREFVQSTVIRQLVRILCIETAPRTPFMRPRNANGITIAHIRGNEMTTAIVCRMQRTKATMLAATELLHMPQPVDLLP